MPIWLMLAHQLSNCPDNHARLAAPLDGFSAVPPVGLLFSIVTSVRPLDGHTRAARKRTNFKEDNFPDRHRPLRGTNGDCRMSAIFVLLELAKNHPAETLAFTMFFGWLWHSVARPDLG